jgi:hypothetical protein
MVAPYNHLLYTVIVTSAYIDDGHPVEPESMVLDGSEVALNFTWGKGVILHDSIRYGASSAVINTGTNRFEITPYLDENGRPFHSRNKGRLRCEECDA